jgi:hypothetical protein
VLYLGDWETVRAAADRLDTSPIEQLTDRLADTGRGRYRELLRRLGD